MRSDFPLNCCKFCFFYLIIIICFCMQKDSLQSPMYCTTSQSYLLCKYKLVDMSNFYRQSNDSFSCRQKCRKVVSISCSRAIYIFSREVLLPFMSIRSNTVLIFMVKRCQAQMQIINETFQNHKQYIDVTMMCIELIILYLCQYSDIIIQHV